MVDWLNKFWGSLKKLYFGSDKRVLGISRFHASVQGFESNMKEHLSRTLITTGFQKKQSYTHMDSYVNL